MGVWVLSLRTLEFGAFLGFRFQGFAVWAMSGGLRILHKGLGFWVWRFLVLNPPQTLNPQAKTLSP